MGYDETPEIPDAQTPMRIRVSNPEEVDALREFLDSRVDAIVERVSDHELEVSLLGSFTSDAMRMELALRIRAWEAARRAAGVRVDITG